MENSYISFINSRVCLYGINNEQYMIPPAHSKRLSDIMTKLTKLPVSKIVLYGSCARSAAKYNSDIDLVLVADDFSHDTQTEIRKLRSDYSDGEGPDVDLHCVSALNYEKGDGWFVQNVRKDGIILWKK